MSILPQLMTAFYRSIRTALNSNPCVVKRRLKRSITLVCLLAIATSAVCRAEGSLSLYIDADRTGTKASGLAIEKGIRTALSEVDNRLGPHAVELKIRDHRGSSVRSRMHLDEYLKDDSALAVFSGLHSPPLLSNLNFINKKQALVLDPWAAAGPITRPKTEENWIFRLSVDDTKAGKVISNEAVLKEGFSKPYLLLEETGWGKSNLKTMTAALEALNIEPAGVHHFNWSLGENAARIALRKIVQSGADVIFLVANAPEGKTFVKAMLSLTPEERLPIRSHWGITGGDFPQEITKQQRAQIDLSFIQTRFSFINHGKRPRAKKVLQLAQTLFPEEITKAEDIKAPTGFIHSYDLTRILIAAVKQVKFTGDIVEDRKLVHHALENLEEPVVGLIKTYNKPFQKYSTETPDAHEALGEKDFVMGYYGNNDEIILRVAK